MDTFISLKYFVLIIGNARSGSTLLGSLINAHPNALIANETLASRNFWRNLSCSEIIDIIILNSKIQPTDTVLPSGNMLQIAKKTQSDTDQIFIIGEKIWNPTTLLLHGNFGLLQHLAQVMEVPIKMVHAIRNPFDAIATMHIRSGAPVADRIRWYFMHCDAVQAISDKTSEYSLKHVNHEKLLKNPDDEMLSLYSFLDLPFDADHLKQVKEVLFPQPRLSRNLISWSEAEYATILNRMKDYDFLNIYQENNFYTTQTKLR